MKNMLWFQTILIENQTTHTFFRMTDGTPPGIRVQIISVQIMLNNMAHDNMVFPYAKKKL